MPKVLPRKCEKLITFNKSGVILPRFAKFLTAKAVRKKNKGRLCAIAALSFPVIEVKIKTNSACSFFYI